MRITLKHGRERAVRSGHPWIFSGAIAAIEGEGEAGTMVEVCGADGRLVGRGAWNPHTSIAVRMMVLGSETVDAALVRARLETALRLRALVRDSDAFRIVNGEGDYFPGLVVDRYADFLVCQFMTAGAESLKALVVAALEEIVAPSGIFERSEGSVRTAEGLPPSTGVLAGKEPPPDLTIVESGRRFRVDLRGGQKTGFFLDQRANRDLVAGLAAGRRTLNLFAYTGAFAVAAAQGGASFVTSVESSPAALVLAEDNWRTNGLAADGGTFVRGDVFAYLRGEVARADLVILDPPPLARRRVDRERALAGYKDVNLHALRACALDAIVLTFSCSQHVAASEFTAAVAAAAADARRSCQVLARLGPAIDHPQSLAHPEGRYLKGLLLRVGAGRST